MTSKLLLTFVILCFCSLNAAFAAASKTPKSIPVFLASDHNYENYVAVTMTSICHNTKSFVNFYILDSGISKQTGTNIKRLQKTFGNCTVEFIEINTNKIFNGFRTRWCFPSLAMYSRFLIPELKPDIDKAIYLDVDLIVMGDIAELYEQELSGRIIGAVQEKADKQDYIKSLCKKLGIKGTYFNSGVLLIDCKLWRENNITEKLFEIQKKYHDEFLHPDQDVLNIYFDGNYKKLEPKYNNMDEASGPALIRHYAGLAKPWNMQYAPKEWLFYENMSLYEKFKIDAAKKLNKFYYDIQAAYFEAIKEKGPLTEEYLMTPGKYLSDYLHLRKFKNMNVFLELIPPNCQKDNLNCANITVDINGSKPPNQEGFDLFRFAMTNNNILPIGYKYDLEKSCSMATGVTWGCSAWVIYNKNTEYLKCNDLKWDVKTRCD